MNNSIILIVFTLVSLIIGTTISENVVWDKSVQCDSWHCDFNDGSNWVGGVAPSSNDIAFIEIPITELKAQNIFSFDNIQISGLVLNGTSTAPLGFTSFSNFQVKGDVFVGNFSTFIINYYGILSVAGDLTVVNNGVFQALDYVSVIIDGGALFDTASVYLHGINGSLSITGDSFFNGNATLSHFTTVTLGGIATITGWTPFTALGDVTVEDLIVNEAATFNIGRSLVATSILLDTDANLNVDYSVVVRILDLGLNAQFIQNQDQIDTTDGSPITVEIDSVSSTRISTVIFGKADSVNVPSIYLPLGYVTSTDLVDQLNLGGQDDQSTLFILQFTLGNPHTPTGVFSANLTNIAVTHIWDTKLNTSPNTTLYFNEYASWATTTFALNNAAVYIGNQALLNLTNSQIQLVGNSVVQVSPFSSLLVKDSALQTQSIIANKGNITVQNSTVSGTITTQSSQVSISSPATFGSLILQGESILTIDISNPLSTIVSNVPITIQNSFSFGGTGTVTVTISNPSSLKAGQVYYIAVSPSLSIYPDQITLATPLPNQLTSSFDIITSNNSNLNYLILNIQ
ncbi:hypothetical protein DFA_06538 [Cavenderia fasciculata]|uniref:Uncharacterized protein n=1 Tax=Cavenderia fasciculata TaxID=261658 RepID=F4PJA2_CACFS|nr:uncharacterized protein DFA_06538 [Cavenderia fasciculata]EGG24388.1 hypothetical protein DFA_06538 [Cavenderia fasciculata]|eukprot:XP_004362239.1 hypothetical protein DFA_06538 [Cavenderia fasciculata]